MIDLSLIKGLAIATGLIAAGGSYTTEALDVTKLQGLFSLQWLVIGDGTMKAEVLVSNDGVTFFDLDDEITSAQTKSTGTSGANMIAFQTTVCEQIKIKFTETSGANSINVTARLRAI